MSYKWYVLTIVSEMGVYHFLYFGTATDAIQFAGAEILPDFEGVEIIGVILEDQETFIQGNNYMRGMFGDEEQKRAKSNQETCALLYKEFI